MTARGGLRQGRPPFKFFTNRSPSGKTHALWCPPDGPGMEPPEMPDYTVCKLDVTEEWEPDSNSEWPTCKNCLSALVAIYAQPVEQREGSVRG